MTFEFLNENFFHTNLLKIEYVQQGATIQLTKNPIAVGVWSVSMKVIPKRVTKKRPVLDKVPAGYIDRYWRFCFPTKEFLDFGVDACELTPGDPRTAVRDAIRNEAIDIAKHYKKVKLTDEEKKQLYRFAEEWVFAGMQDADIHYQHLSATCWWMNLDPCEYKKPTMMDKQLAQYIQGRGVIDLLSDTPDWAKNAAKRWLYAKVGGSNNKNRCTQLYLLRRDLSMTSQVVRYVKEIYRDATLPIHRYAAMQLATKTLVDENVEVEYQLPDGTCGHGEIPAACFQYFPCRSQIACIANPPHSTLTQRAMVHQFMPNKMKRMDKLYVTLISHNGRIIWKAPKPKEEGQKIKKAS